jgi:steroid delta-isomerase-like uncharacterized protein
MISPAEMGRLWFEEVWSKRRSAAIRELSAPGAVGHLAFRDAHVADIEGYHAAMLAACPDLTIEVEHVLADGEQVAVRWRARGTHRHDAFDIPAKGRPWSLCGVTWLRVSEGQIAEAWDCWDQSALLAKWAE